MMKNITHLLFLVAGLLALFGCETESDDWKDVGYTSLSIEMEFQADETKSYTALYNDQEISMRLGNSNIILRSDTVGVLKIFNDNESTPEMEETIHISPGKPISLIQLSGQPVTLYEEEDFLKISATLALYEGYKAVFNDQEILDGENYIRKENTTGNLEFYKEDETAPVYSIEDITVEAGQSLIILQSSETEFVSLEGGNGEEEAPATENLSKVNFFYTPSGALNIDAVKMEMYSLDHDVNEVNLVATVTIEKGKLSPYIELDLAQYQETYGTQSIFAYSLYNAETNELIEDVWNGNTTFNLDAQPEDQFKTKYKFVTFQVTNAGWGYPPQFIMGEEWETSAAE